MPQVIQLSRPGAGPLYVCVAAIAAISPASFSEAWQGIRARVQLLDGRWYRVSQCPEEILGQMNGRHEAPSPPLAGQVTGSLGWCDGAEGGAVPG